MGCAHCCAVSTLEDMRSLAGTSARGARDLLRRLALAGSSHAAVADNMPRTGANRRQTRYTVLTEDLKLEARATGRSTKPMCFTTAGRNAMWELWQGLGPDEQRKYDARAICSGHHEMPALVNNGSVVAGHGAALVPLIAPVALAATGFDTCAS